MDWKIELVAIPVTDVDRAISFYRDQVGFVLDHDHKVDGGIRFVQFTPPGSACSIVLGTGVTDMEPGSQRGVQVVVTDADAAHAELASKEVEVSDIQTLPWGRFVRFADPDGNTWSLQELPKRD
jgi:catechol 2,3-dioxygenase-like lactoylglutathione lyase family enzyme